MAVKSLIKTGSAPKATPAMNGNARAVQKKIAPGLFTPSLVQRKEQTGSWVHTQTQKPINARTFIQPKLKIHPSNDHFEQEADHVADKVTSNQKIPFSTSISKVNGGTQRKSLSSNSNRASRAARILQSKHNSAKINLPVQSKNSSTSFCGNSLQCADSGPPVVQQAEKNNKLQSVLSQQSTRGSPLPTTTRTHMESRMGADFSAVRIHTGNESHEAGRSIGARAFTNGPNIHFANGQYNPDTKAGQHLLAHELTHTLQQGATPARSNVQRSSDNFTIQKNSTESNSERGPPLQAQAETGTVQCSLIDTALDRIGELLDDLPSITEGLEGAKRWLTGKVRRFATFIPGYTALGVVLQQDPITGEHIDRSGRNFINAALDIIPGGSLLKQKLEELGAIDRAGAWIDTQLESLSSILAGVHDEFMTAWNALGITSILAGPLNIIRNFGNIFLRAINQLVSFAERAAAELLSIVKEFLLTQVVNFIKNHTNAYELLKVIIGHDPITEERVERNGTNILNALLELGGEQGREQRRQMQDTGSFQKAADWIDRGIAVFGNLYQTIRDNFGLIWNAVSIQSLMDPIGTFNRIYNTFAEPVGRVLQFVADTLVVILGFIKEVLLQRLSAWARTVRGYPLVTVLIGKDPFTNENVQRSVPNIIRGFMSLMEGGEDQYRQMEESGAIGRAVAQINAAVTRLNMTPAYVVQLFTDLWNSFSFNDLSHPIEAFQRIITRFGEPIARLIAFVFEIVRIVIHVILQVMNFPFDLITNIINRAMQAIESIKRDPIGFLKNLMRAIKQGFIQFFDNIVTHLMNGVVGWLMSELRDANIPELRDFSLRGVIAWILQVLGISMEAIWAKLAAHPRIGPERVARIRSMINTLEGIWTFIQDVQQRGMAAIWDKISEQLSNLWNTVLDAVKNWIMERIVSQVTARLLSLLDPTGIMAVINSAIAIYRAIQSFIRYLRQMLEVINSFVNGVAEVAAGNVSPAANALERTMGRAMPIVIGFLANQVGLSGIGRRIGEMVTRAREMVDQALTWLVNRAVNTGMSIIDRLMSMGRSAVGAVMGWLGLRKRFNTPNGEQHQLYFENRGGRSQIMVASNPMTLREFVTSIRFPPNRPPSRDVLLDQQLAIAFLDRVELLTHTPPAGMSESDRTTEIRTRMEVVSETVARLMMIAGGRVRSSTAPVFAGTYGDFARGMRVEIVNQPVGNGSDASALGPMWNKLLKRRAIGGGQVGSYYVRGHLLSQYLGGDGSIWRNLTPLTQAANQDHESRIESPLKRRVEANADHAFIYVVNPAYGRSVNTSAITFVNSHPTWNALQKQNAIDLIQTEQFVPTSLICTIQEIDPLTGREIPSALSGTHTVSNTILDGGSASALVANYIVQTKLKATNSNNHYEKEADHIADRVTGQTHAAAPISISRINGGIQTKIKDDKNPVAPKKNEHKVETALNNQQTRGSPLPAPVKTTMENKMGADFSKVRIHTGADSQKANDAIGARAFTHGANIHFGAGEFDPSSKKGQHLLAHELTHTVQQGAASQKQIANPPDKKIEQTPEKNKGPITTPPIVIVVPIANTTKPPVGIIPPAATSKPVVTKNKLDDEKESVKTTGFGAGQPKTKSGAPGAKAITPISTKMQPGKAPTGSSGTGAVTPKIDEKQPLASISAYSPTQVGKGFAKVQQLTNEDVNKHAKKTISDLPKVPLASGSAYGSPVTKHSKGYKEGTTPKNIDGLSGKPGFIDPKLPETKIPEPPTFTPVSLPTAGASDKDEVNASKANEALDDITLDTEGVPEKMIEHPTVELTGEADPANMDDAMGEQAGEVEKEKTAAAKDIWLDYGENNVIKKPGKGKIATKRKLKPAAIAPRRLSTNNTYPDYFEAKAATFTNGDPYRKMDAESGKYYTQKQLQEDQIISEDQKSKAEIEAQSQLSKQTQTGAQQKVLGQVGTQRQLWNQELNDADKNFNDSALLVKTDYNQQVIDQKTKGDIDIQQKITDGNTEAAKEHQKAKEEVENEKIRKKNESSGFWGWVRSKASALIDALKSFVNKIFNLLRKAVKMIFDLVKKAIVGLLEIIHKAVVGIIKGFGAALKGLASIALIAFPETRRKVVKAIDGYVDDAVEATDKAFEKFEQVVSDIIDGLAAIVDKCLSIIQDITNIAFDVLKVIVTGLLYILEFLLNIEKQYKVFKAMIDDLMFMWDHPEVVEQKAKEFLQPYINNIPTEAPAQVTKALAQFGLNIAKHVSGILGYLLPNLKHLASNWWGEAKKMIWFLIWPFADGSPLWEDGPKLWRLIPQVWNDFWNGNFSRCIDGCLEWMQALNSVVGAFAGWIVIGGVIVGAIIGSLAGGVGAIPGAGAGFEVGVAIGEGIMASMIATESAVILKAVYDLSVTTDDGEVTTPAAQKAAAEAQKENSTGQPESNGPTVRQSGDVKTGKDRIEYAYQRIANSSLALGIMVALLLLGAIGGKIAQAITSGIKKLAAIVGELAPGLAEGLGKLGSTLKESKVGSALSKASEEFKGGSEKMKGKIDAVKEKVGLGKAKGKVPEETVKPEEKIKTEQSASPGEKNNTGEASPEKPMVHEGGEKIISEDKSIDGKRKLEITEEGKCKICSSPCEDITKKYKTELNQKPELKAKLDELKAEFDSNKISLDDLKKELKKIDESLAEQKALNREAAVKDADKLVNSEGVFEDPKLEADYQEYVTRKTKAGEKPRERGDWKVESDYWTKESPMAKGNAFNDKAVKEKWYDYNEVHLKNGKRLDSYSLDNGGEIVSRKATNLGEIEESTFNSYLDEMNEKYKRGTEIRSDKYPELDGKKLQGTKYLEIPESNKSLPNIDKFIKLAKKRGIEIRFKAFDL